MGSRGCVLLAVLAGAIAGPVAVNEAPSSRCAAVCSESAKFQYTPGNAYEYAYESTATTKLEGASDDASTLQLKAAVSIEVLTKCDFSLKLSDVSFTDKDPSPATSREFKSRLEKHFLRFSFQDGVVDTLCPAAAEDDEVLNLKRGILSTFQTSLASFDGPNSVVEETDVAGVCTTSYEVETGILGTITVKKSKELAGCRNRNGNVTSLSGQPYNLPSALQALPLTKGTQRCEQTIRRGLHTSSSCAETHVLRPFSRQDSGASTEVTTSLKFKAQRSRPTARSFGPATRKTNLLFKHAYGLGQDAAAAKSASTEILTQLCQQVKEDVRPETPELFSSLVRAARGLSSDDMREIMGSALEGRTCSSSRVSKFFLDAIPLIGTPASVAFMSEMILAEKVQGLDVDAWLLQLAFVQQPTAEMLSSLQPLLENDSTRTRSMLGVSSLVQRVCSTQTGCGQLPPVAAAVQAIELALGRDCAAALDANGRESVLVALKAFGNAGAGAASAATLEQCASNTDLGAEVRVAALDAFRRLPCSIQRSTAMKIFQTAAEDSEVRIAAYLAVMTCPDSGSLLSIKMILGGVDSVSQVTSFVWSHLTNLQETSSLFRRDVQAILQDAKLRADYDASVLKYSRNYEKSFISSYLNLGGQVESNLIFSDKSYVPRSAMLNLTVDMFGSSVNLLEVGGRIQGAEAVLDKLFGKDGYFSTDYFKKLMNGKTDQADGLSKVIEKLLKINTDEVQGSVYLRTFGNEILYKGAGSLLRSAGGRGRFDAASLLAKLAERSEHDLTQSGMLVDTTVVMPTAAGFPLNVSILAVATLNVQLGGKMDLLRATTSPRSLEVSGHFKPSGAVRVTGTMGINALSSQSSLQMVSTLHSSTALEGKLKLQDGQVFTVEMKAPKDKTEVLTVESKLLINGRELTSSPLGRTEGLVCTAELVGQLTGLQLCSEQSLPALQQGDSPYFPLSGPAMTKIVLNKVDTMSSYVFEASYVLSKDGKQMGRLSFDTPGSSTNRKLLAELSVDVPKMSIEANMVSPWKKAQAEAAVVDQPDSKQARVRVVVDDQLIYSVTAEVGIDEKKTRSAYTPRLEIRVPGREPITVVATLEQNPRRPAFFELTVNNVFSSAVKVNGAVNKDKSGDTYTSDFAITSPWLSAKADGVLENKKDTQGFRANLEYSDGASSAPQRISAAGKFSDRSKGALNNYKGSLSFSTTHMPWLALSVEAEATHSPDRIDATLKLMHGEDKKTLLLKHTTSKRLLSADWVVVDVSARTTVEYTPKGVSVAIDVKHKHNATDVASSLEIQHAPTGTVRLAWVHANRFDDGLVSAALTADLPGRSIALSSELSRLAEGEYAHKVLVQWAKGSSVELSNTARRLSASTYELTGILKAPEMPVSYSGSLRLDPKDCGVKVEVMHMKNVYSLESKGSWRSPAGASGEVKVVVPQRTVSARTGWEVGDSSLALNANAKWDADRDETKQVLLSAEYGLAVSSTQTTFDASMAATSPLGRLNVITGTKIGGPAATATLALQLNDKKTELSVEYDLLPGRTASGRFLLQSDHAQAALGGSGKYEATFTHLATDQLLRHNLLASSSDGRKFTVNLRADTTSGVLLNADVTTPFSELAKLGVGAVVRGDLTSMQALDVSAVAYVGDKNVTTTVSATRERGQMTMLFPRGTVTTAYSHFFDGLKLRNEATVSWVSKEGPAREGTVRIVTNVGLARGVVGTVTVSTPFQPRQLSLSFDHQGDGGVQFTTQASASWDDQKVSTTVQHSAGEGKVTVVTPWRTTGASYRHQYATTARGSSLATSGELFWSPKEKIAASVAISGLAQQQQPLSAKLRLASPFRGLQELEANLSHLGGATARGFDSSADVSWAPGAKLSASAALSVGTEQATGSLSLRTPFAQLPAFAASFEHSGGSWAQLRTVASVSIADGSPLSFAGSVSQQQPGGGFTALASLANIPSMRLSMVQLAAASTSTSARQTTYTASAKWNNDKELSAQADVNKLADGVDVALKLATPFERAAQVTGKIAHSGVDGSRFSTQLEAAWSPRDKARVAVEYSATSRSLRFDARTPYGSVLASHSGPLTAFTTSAKFTPAAAGVVATEASVEFSSLAGGSLAGKATLTSPYERASSLSASFKHSGATLQEFSNSADLSWGPGRAAGVATSFSTRLGVRGEAKATWPHGGSAEARFEHTGDRSSFKNHVDVTYGGGQQRASLDTQFSQLMGISGSMSFSSTLERMRAFAVAVRHSGSSALQFDNSVQVSWTPGDSASVSTKFSALAGVRGEVALRLPVLGASSVSFQHDGTSASSFANRFDASWGVGGRLSASSQLSVGLVAGLVAGRAGFSSTFERFEQLGASFSHKGTSWSSFENTAELSWAADRKASVGSRFAAADDGSVTAGLELASPALTAKASASHRGADWRDFSSSLALSWAQQQQRQIAASAEFSSLAGVKGKLSLASPFEGFEDVSIELKHSGDRLAFTNRLLVAWAADKQMTLDTNFAHVSGRSYKGSLLFVSPVRRIEGRLDHSGDLVAGFATAAELEYAGKKLAANATYSGSAGDPRQRLAVALSTPLVTLRSARLAAEHSGAADASSIENTVSLAWNDEKPVKIVSRYRNAGNKWQSVELRQTAETPFAGYESLSWAASCTNLADKVEGRAEASSNGDTYQLDVNVRRDVRRGRMDGSVTVRTPLNDYRENQLAANLALTARTLTFSIKGYLGSESAASRLEVTRKNGSVDSTTTSEAVVVKLTSPKLSGVQQLSLSYGLTQSGAYDAEVTATVLAHTAGAKLRGSHGRDAEGGVKHAGLLGINLDLPSYEVRSARQYRYGFDHSSRSCGASFAAIDELRPESNMDASLLGTWSTGAYAIELKLNTPYERLRECSASAKLGYTPASIDASLEALYMQRSVVAVSVAADWLDKVQASFALATPYDSVQSLSASMLLQNAEQPWSLQGGAQYNDRAVKVAGSWKLVGSELDSSLQLITPFDSVGTVRVALKNSLTEDRLSLLSSLAWGSAGHHVDLTVSAGPRSESSVLDVSTPLPQLTSLYLKRAFAYQPGRITYEHVFKINDMPEALSIGFLYDKDSDNLVELKVDSPWTDVRSAQLTGWCNTKAGVSASVGVALNSEKLLQLSIKGSAASLRTNSGEIVIESEKWSQYIRAKMDNELDFSDKVMSMLAELEYARGKMVALQYSHEQTPDGTVRLKLTSPFPEANFSYMATYSKAKTSSDYTWREHTEFTCSVLTMVSDTDFLWRSGLTMSHKSTLSYKGATYVTDKAIRLIGTASKFDAGLTCKSSYSPAVSAVLSWSAAPLLLKAKVNEYQYELSHRGDWTDFECKVSADFPYRSAKQQLSGSLAFRNSPSQGLSVSVEAQTPFAELTSFKASVRGNETAGSSSASLVGVRTYSHSTSFDRSLGFRSVGEIKLDGSVPAKWDINSKAEKSELDALATFSLLDGRVVTSTARTNSSQGSVVVKDSNNVGFTLAFDDAPQLSSIPKLELSLHMPDGTTDTYSLAKAYALARAA